MARDYGVRRRGRERLPLPAIIAGLGLTAAIAGAVEVHQAGLRHAANKAAASYWEVSGPPCPSLTAAEFVRRGLKAPQVFDYNDLVIGRKVGHVSCGAAGDDQGRALSTHEVCEFTGPVVLRVTSKRRDYFFEPGVGKPATITMDHGVPRCVMASNFTISG